MKNKKEKRKVAHISR